MYEGARVERYIYRAHNMISRNFEYESTNFFTNNSQLKKKTQVKDQLFSQWQIDELGTLLYGNKTVF